MKILWNNHRDPADPRAGGAERTIDEIGKRLVSSGDEVHLLTSGWTDAESHTTSNGIRIHRFRGYVRPHLQLPRLLRQLEPDVIVDDLAHVIPWGSPFFSRTPGVAFFRHLHRRTLPGQASRLTAGLLGGVELSYPLIYRNFRFVVESEQSCRDLTALGVPPSSIIQIRPGVDLYGFRPGLVTERPSLLFFAGLRAYKRPQESIRVLKLLRDSGVDCSLSMVGDGPMLTRLHDFTKELQLESHVTFTGRLPLDELQRLVRRSWVNINCSTAEGWGYSIMEAAAAGIPTAAYGVPGVCEAVGYGEAGSTVPNGNTVRLAEMVRTLIESRSEWAVRCRHYAEQYSWEICASRWSDLLESLPRQSGGG